MIEELQKLGLEYYEAKALHILFNGRFSLKDLSKKSGIPFGKVYSIVKKLKEKGFVLETNSRPKLVYVENSSDIIDKLIKNKDDKEKILKEKLRNIATEIDKSKGKSTKFFEIGTNTEDNKRIQMRSFKEAEEEILQIINIHHKPKSNRESKTLWEKEIILAVNKGVKFKSIYPTETILPKKLLNLNKKSPNDFMVKRLNTDFIRCDIIDRKKVLLKIVQPDPINFGGIFFIENEKLAENLIKIFEEFWSEAD